MQTSKKGLRVVRGPDWKWGEQDGGEGGVGTVLGDCIDPKSQPPGSFYSTILPFKTLWSSILNNINTERKKDEGFVTVIWDNGMKGVYRAGAEGPHDLRVVDSCASGVRHLDESCQSCLAPEILGMRWQCTICYANFCSSCFFEIKDKERHEHYEIFMRYDSPDSEPVLITVMSNRNETIQLKGIYKGAKVKRGPHWSYGNEDDGQIGEVMACPSEDIRNQKINNKVYVKWRSNTNRYLPYRRGEEGKIDVQVVECAVGGRYHPEWLPVLRATSDVQKEFGKTVSAMSHFSSGDLVEIGHTLDSFREKQSECAGWNPLMSKLINQTGTVIKVSENLVQVNFDGSERKWSLNPTVLTKLSQFSVGQIVRIKDDDETLKMMQLKLGNKIAYSMAGETGSITSIEIGENHKSVFLALMDVKTTSAQAMQPDWLEAIPGSAKLQEKFSRIKSNMVNLFIEAAGEGDFHLVRELINNYKVPVDSARKSDGVTALHLACRSGHLKLVQWLLEEKKADIEKVDYKGRRAIYFTIKGCQPEVLNLLIKKGVELDPLTIKKKYSPLLKAAAKQYTELAQILIKTNCCNVNLQDENGNTALHFAVIGRRKSDLFDALVQCDCTDLTIRNDMDCNVFHSAVIFGNLEVLEFILDSKNIGLALERVTSSHYSILHLASVNGDLKVAQFILERLSEKLSVDDEDNMGNTALMIASARCQYGLVELFIKTGKANVNKMNYMGDTPISITMKKIRIIQRIPLSEDSPDIYKVYEELCEKDRDTMNKYPSLAAVCYLIDKGGKLEINENEVNDPKVCELLKSSVTKYQMEVEDAGDRRLVIIDDPSLTCILCPNQTSSNITYKCCNKKSLTCINCYSCLRYCPSCKKPMESFRRKYDRLDNDHFDDLMNYCDDDIYLNSYSMNSKPDLPIQNSKEVVPIVEQQQSPEKVATNIPPSSIILPAAGSVHQVTQIRPVIPSRQFAFTYSSVRPSNMSFLNLKRTSLPNVLPITSPIIIAPTSASSSSPSQPVGASAPATLVHRRPLILMRAGVPPHQSSSTSSASADKNVVDISFIGKSRRGSDKIVDSLGNSYTKRFKSAGIWQCTRQQGGNSKNRCSAVIKEKDGKFFLVKGTHNHGGNDKNDTTATASVNLPTVSGSTPSVRLLVSNDGAPTA